nr:putative integron gene cassette protein [uncultured bacterium]
MSSDVRQQRQPVWRFSRRSRWGQTFLTVQRGVSRLLLRTDFCYKSGATRRRKVKTLQRRFAPLLLHRSFDKFLAAGTARAA